jgi:hypothetical protein
MQWDERRLLLTGNIFPTLLLTGNAIPALRKTITHCDAISEVAPNTYETRLRKD